jgi:hypothetical protein
MEFSALMYGSRMALACGRQRQPQAKHQAQRRADGKGQQGLQQRHAQVQVDVGTARQAVGEQRALAKTKRHEPRPDAAQHLDGLTQKERVLLITRGQLPHPQKHKQHTQLPPAQVFVRGFEGGHISCGFSELL